MKKLQLKLDGMQEMLSKEQMKRIVGGYDGSEPDGPSAGGVDDTNSSSGNGYKCCWSSDPTNCSRCAPNATRNWTCVSGAVLTAC